MAELYLVLETCDMLRVLLVLDLNFGFENLVDTFHAGKSLWDVVASSGKFLQWVDDAIEHHQVEDDGRSIDTPIIQYQDAAKP